MNTLITTEGFITDKQLVRKLGRAGILLSYYIDCYKFYADESGVFYRSRSDIRLDTTISDNSQKTYETQLTELGLIQVKDGGGNQANRIQLFPDNVILCKANLRDDNAKLRCDKAKLRHAHAKLRCGTANLLVNERIPTNELTEEITDVQLTPYEPSITLSHFDIKNIQTLSSGAIATSSIYSKLSPEDVEYYKNFKLN
jgi:hypothetical protein